VILLLLPLLAGTTGCSSFQRVEEHPRWTLLAQDLETVDAASFRQAYEPAFAAVEAEFGPFERRVRVHVWREGEEGDDQGARGVGHEQDESGARVRAFHVRGASLFGPPAGIHDASADPGTAVHELVHARLAELGGRPALWFEEGLAGVLGDGCLVDGAWVVDGLAAWPVRELRERPLELSEVESLLAVGASDDGDLAESVRVHFLGWAVVFDLYRESGRFAWQDWARRARRMSAEEALERARRSVSDETELAWLARLDDADRRVRLATAKGLWKLHSERVLPALLERLENEQDQEVRVALGLNALAAAGERPPSGALAGRMWRRVWPALRRAELEDPAEDRAVAELLRSFRWRSGTRSNEPLDQLRRFWAE
jgi:hypothetical protein